MIITLKGADFSASNIGTLSSWRITRSLGSGATYAGVTSVDKGASFTATVTIAEGYELGTAGVTVTMGGTTLSDVVTISENVITITIAEVTGNVLIKVPTVNTATGEEDEPGGGNVETDGILLTSVASQVLSDTGLNVGNYTTYADDTTKGRTTFMEVPIEPNTSYSGPHIIRVWYLNSSKNGISTENPSQSDPKWKFTTPANAAYISATFREVLADGTTKSSNDATIVKL